MIKDIMEALSQISWPSFALSLLLTYMMYGIWYQTITLFLKASRDSLQAIHNLEVDRVTNTTPGSPERYEATMSNWFFYTRPVMTRKHRYLLALVLFIFSWVSLMTVILTLGEALRNIGS